EKVKGVGKGSLFAYPPRPAFGKKRLPVPAMDEEHVRMIVQRAEMTFGRSNVVAHCSARVKRRHDQEEDALHSFAAALVDRLFDGRMRILEGGSDDEMFVHCSGQESRVLLRHGRKRGASTYQSVTLDRLLFHGRGQLAPCERVHEFGYFIDRARPSEIDEQHSALFHLRLLPLCTTSMRRE